MKREEILFSYEAFKQTLCEALDPVDAARACEYADSDECHDFISHVFSIKGLSFEERNILIGSHVTHRLYYTNAPFRGTQQDPGKFMRNFKYIRGSEN